MSYPAVRAAYSYDECGGNNFQRDHTALSRWSAYPMNEPFHESATSLLRLLYLRKSVLLSVGERSLHLRLAGNLILPRTFVLILRR